MWTKSLTLFFLFACGFLQLQVAVPESWARETTVAQPPATGEVPAPAASADEPPEARRAENLPAGINDGFLDPDLDPAEYVKRFEVESREVFASRHQIIEAIKLEPGMAVADIGAGTGLFMQALSRSVGPSGQVYAVELAPNFVKHLRERARLQRLENVEVVPCTERHANLPDQSVDRVFLCDVYHHFEYPQATLRSLHAALRPGGKLILIDFHRQPEGVSPARVEWLSGHVRADQDVFRREIEQAGFEFLDEVRIEGFVENYLLRFLKPELSASGEAGPP